LKLFKNFSRIICC